MFEIPLPILILQHPQEPNRSDHEISSAQILQDQLSLVHVATGLSWKNLAQVTCKFKAIEGMKELETPALWHTLYLGTKAHGEADEGAPPGIYYLNKKGEATEPKDLPEIGGLILLDGTWAQAKTLWWRNAWLLKTKRIYIIPKTKSLYGNLRKEPRPECVSTLEAAAETLSFLGIDPAVEAGLKAAFAATLKIKKKA